MANSELQNARQRVSVESCPCASLSKPKPIEQFLHCQIVVSRDALEDSQKCPDFDWIVIGDGLMMLAALLSGHANVRTALAILHVAQCSQRFDQLRPGNVARDFHRAR